MKRPVFITLVGGEQRVDIGCKSERSPRGAKRNAGCPIERPAPDFAALHPGYDFA